MTYEGNSEEAHNGQMMIKTGSSIFFFSFFLFEGWLLENEEHLRRGRGNGI